MQIILIPEESEYFFHKALFLQNLATWVNVHLQESILQGKFHHFALDTYKAKEMLRY